MASASLPCCNFASAAASRSSYVPARAGRTKTPPPMAAKRNACLRITARDLPAGLRVSGLLGLLDQVVRRLGHFPVPHLPKRLALQLDHENGLCRAIFEPLFLRRGGVDVVTHLLDRIDRQSLIGTHEY